MFDKKYNPIFEYGFLVILSILAGYYLIDLISYALAGNIYGNNFDFNHYYNAATRLFEDTSNFYLNERENITYEGFTYPPLAVALFVPYLIFDIFNGSILYSIFIVLNVIVSAILLLKLFECSQIKLNKIQKIILVLFLVGTAPAMQNYIVLQVNFIVLNTCLGYILCIEKNKSNWLAGLILASGIWLKIYPILLFGMGVLYQKYRPSIICVLVWLLVLPIIFLPIIPLELYVHYFKVFLPELFSHGMANIQNQSMVASIARQIFPIDQLSYFDFEVTTGLRIVSLCLVGLFCSSALFIRIKKGEEYSIGLLFAVMSMTVMIASVAWTYSWILAMPFVIYMIFESRFKILVMMLSSAYFIPGYMHIESIIPLESMLGAIFYSRYSIVMLSLLVIFFAEEFTKLKSSHKPLNNNA